MAREVINRALCLGWSIFKCAYRNTIIMHTSCIQLSRLVLGIFPKRNTTILIWTGSCLLSEHQSASRGGLDSRVPMWSPFSRKVLNFDHRFRNIFNRKCQDYVYVNVSNCYQMSSKSFFPKADGLIDGKCLYVSHLAKFYAANSPPTFKENNLPIQ